MTEGHNSIPRTPTARLQFARRLKELRTKRGYSRARHFAQVLGVEEMRYTRYERAEVEPGLALIQKMCLALNTTPNALLGSWTDPTADQSSNGTQHGPARRKH